MESFIKNLARGAGAILREGFTKEKDVKNKTESWDLVTKYDVLVEQFIIGKIKKKFPGHGILAEESGHTVKKNNFWVIDPLDGTHAFIKGTPQFSTTFAFVSNNKIIYGVVYDPMSNEFFFAKAGHGATVNGKKTIISKAKDLRYRNMAFYNATALGKIEGSKLRRLVYNKIITEYEMWTDRAASIALGGAYVAAGRFDFILAKGMQPWDICAAALIIKESGGRVTDLEDKNFYWKFGDIMAGNPILHKQVSKIMNHG